MAQKTSSAVVAKRRENVLALPGEVTRTALILPADLPEPDWQTVGDLLTDAESGVMWWLGDWWAFGENQEYGDRKTCQPHKKEG